MKAHIGVDRDSGLVHTVVSTAANVADVTQAQKLLHGKEREVQADAGYLEADKREELKDKRVCWNIAERRSRIRALPEGELKILSEFIEHLTAKVRARAEHPFKSRAVRASEGGRPGNGGNRVKSRAVRASKKAVEAPWDLRIREVEILFEDRQGLSNELCKRYVS